MQGLERLVEVLERENCNLKTFIESRGLTSDFASKFGESRADAIKSEFLYADMNAVAAVAHKAKSMHQNGPEEVLSAADWTAQIEDLRHRRVQLLRNMVDCINTGGVKKLLENSQDIWHSDFILVQGFSGEEICGMEQIQQWWIKNGDIVPDLQFTEFNIFPRTSSADKIRVRWTIEGTFKHPERIVGPFPKNGSVGSALIAAMLPVMRNKPISISGFSHCIFRGVKLEQVVHSHDYSTLLAQILGMKSQAVVGEVTSLFQNLAVE